MLALPRRAIAMAATAAGAATIATEAAPAKDSTGLSFRFGVIADIQYCDCDNATNFGGSETRGPLPETINGG